VTLQIAAQANNKDWEFSPNVTSNEKAWAESLKRKAAGGSAEAQYELGRAYIEGHVFNQNVGEAVKWTRAAAVQGLAKGEVNLAVMYSEGRWVPRDYAQARVWNEKAAAQGDARAEYNLGVLYAYGQGVKKDLPQGIQWYAKAAEQGHQMAAYNVGVAYSQGIGVPIDEVKGYMWQLLACHFGFGHCKETLKYLDANLSPAKIAEARKKANEWIKSHPDVKGISL
ncbi:MAG: tetratricopeptide repeat protein, partial [Terriglobales bacterium]